MSSLPTIPAAPCTEGSPIAAEPPAEMSAALGRFLAEAQLVPGHQLPDLVARQARLLGGEDAMIFLVDLQQEVLVPLLGSRSPGQDETIEPLPVDSTLAGRCYQHAEVLTQDAGDNALKVWLPFGTGCERLGVLTLTLGTGVTLDEADSPLLAGLLRLAALAGQLVMTKTMYGDTLVCARRRASMGLAAELQWSLLPPLSFACRDVVVSGVLEPAYQVAGDTVDYAIDHGWARVALFDGMGHGLHSAQLAALTVAANRNARRAGRSLTETALFIEEAISAGVDDMFTTGVLAELNTVTGILEWVNAGHPEPLLVRGARVVKQLRVTPALPLGLAHLTGDIAQADFPVGAERLEPGDRVLFYSDGVIEARSPDGDFFGLERFIDLLERTLAAALPAPETMRRVVRALLAHQAGQLNDDATLLMLEWHGRPSG